MFFSDLVNAMPLESKGLSDYTFNEHESYPPFLSACHQQELLDLIHAFKFYMTFLPTNSYEEPILLLPGGLCS